MSSKKPHASAATLQRQAGELASWLNSRISPLGRRLLGRIAESCTEVIVAEGAIARMQSMVRKAARHALGHLHGQKRPQLEDEGLA